MTINPVLDVLLIVEYVSDLVAKYATERSDSLMTVLPRMTPEDRAFADVLIEHIDAMEAGIEEGEAS